MEFYYINKRLKVQKKTFKITMKAKPFIKWVGGKGQLIEQLEALLPADFDKWENVTYIEPFVGGGAMLYNHIEREKIQ